MLVSSNCMPRCELQDTPKDAPLMTVLNSYQPRTTGPADVCIIGSGPSGLPLALKLSKAGLSVDLIESGLDCPSAHNDALNGGDSSGIENARLLLLSNNVESAGLLNDGDLVGRYFFEHSATYSFGTIFCHRGSPLGLPLADGHTIFPPPVESSHVVPPTGGFGFGGRLCRRFLNRKHCLQLQHQLRFSRSRVSSCWCPIGRLQANAYP